MEERRSAASVRAVLGLGNPGPRYERTRHNAGFLVLDSLRRGPWSRCGNRQESRLARPAGGPASDLILARPLTFMNLSGEAAADLLAVHELLPSELLAVADDAALPFGRLRIRAGGSAGGHRGLLSICEQIGTDQFPRLRIGIGPPPPGTDMIHYVLEPLEGEAWASFERTLARAAEAVRVLWLEGLVTAMNRFHVPETEPSESGPSPPAPL